MLNPDEEIISILSKLEENSIFALARTTTQDLKKSATINEAIANIIKYSPNPLSILRRKAITREILFNYLDENNITVKLPTTKNELIDTVVALWGLPNSNCLVENTIKTSQEVSIDKQKEPINDMAVQFAEWFYSIVNKDECGPEHFFNDGKIKVNTYMNAEACATTEIENDPKKISNLLSETKTHHNLHFNPNITSDGVQGRRDPHGLVLIMVCGTLHVQNTCVGIFEQIFALARDPFSDNNWKIKRTELNLKAKSNTTENPKLCNSELTNNLLMLPLQ